jgi:hypothetical protein
VLASGSELTQRPRDLRPNVVRDEAGFAGLMEEALSLDNWSFTPVAVMLDQRTDGFYNLRSQVLDRGCLREHIN